MATQPHDVAPEPDVVSVAEFAQRLGVDRNRLTLLARTRRVPEPIKLTQRTLIWRRADVDRWFDNGCPAPDQDGRTEDDGEGHGDCTGHPEGR